MDPVSIGVVAALLVSKAAERGGEQAVDASSRALGDFARWLRGRLSGRSGAAALEAVEQVPDSPLRVAALGQAVDEHADGDSGFAAELDQQVDHAGQQGVDVTAITQHAVGNGIVQVAGNHGSVSVTNTSPTAPPPPR